MTAAAKTGKSSLRRCAATLGGSRRLRFRAIPIRDKTSGSRVGALAGNLLIQNSTRSWPNLGGLHANVWIGGLVFECLSGPSEAHQREGQVGGSFCPLVHFCQDSKRLTLNSQILEASELL